MQGGAQGEINTLRDIVSKLSIPRERLNIQLDSSQCSRARSETSLALLSLATALPFFPTQPVLQASLEAVTELEDADLGRELVKPRRDWLWRRANPRSSRNEWNRYICSL